MNPSVCGAINLDSRAELRAGGFAGALASELEQLGSTLRPESGPRDLLSAGVRVGSRTASVTCAANERAFHVDFWNDGVQSAGGWTAELPQAARAAAEWFERSASVRGVAERFAFLKPNPLAEAYEAGSAIEFRWGELLDDPRHEELQPSIAEASGRAELRRLFAFTSLFSLCFSRWVGYPFSEDLPAAKWQDGTFRVVDASNRPIGSGDEVAAVDLLVDGLPPVVDVLYRWPADE
jgi:hypothetical protein